MPTYQLLIWILKAIWLFFIFAYGACLGSLTNVIVYRMPLGLSIVSPPSRCPKCNTKLSWRDNIPVFGWLFLKGKCRYCKNPISAEYPIVEAAMGLLFVVFFVVWYLIPNQAVFLGIDWGEIKPTWAAMYPVEKTWPEFVVVLLLVGSLFAMTLVDAKTFTIPIVLTWVPAVIGVIAHPLHAAWLSRPSVVPPKSVAGWRWAIPTPGDARWDWVGLCTGGMVGLGIALLLLRAGKLRRSFADYNDWEAKVKAEAAAKNPPPLPDSPEATEAPFPCPDLVSQDPAPASPPPPSSPELWMEYPHARREMVKELLFLAPCVGLMALGWWLGTYLGGVAPSPVPGRMISNTAVPLWLSVLTGVLQGYLIGGGIVWAVRIFGSLGFGREAMGLGDVHLMAGVGASVGWFTATMGFFGAAFVGLAWAILGRIAGGKFQRMMPYGPFLAIATVLVLLGRPLIVLLVGRLLGPGVSVPP